MEPPRGLRRRVGGTRGATGAATGLNSEYEAKVSSDRRELVTDSEVNVRGCRADVLVTRCRVVISGACIS